MKQRVATYITSLTHLNMAWRSVPSCPAAARILASKFDWTSVEKMAAVRIGADAKVHSKALLRALRENIGVLTMLK